jgi:hypothetical protein
MVRMPFFHDGADGPEKRRDSTNAPGALDVIVVSNWSCTA